MYASNLENPWRWEMKHLLVSRNTHTFTLPEKKMCMCAWGEVWGHINTHANAHIHSFLSFFLSVFFFYRLLKLEVLSTCCSAQSFTFMQSLAPLSLLLFLILEMQLTYLFRHTFPENSYRNLKFWSICLKSYCLKNS